VAGRSGRSSDMPGKGAGARSARERPKGEAAPRPALEALRAQYRLLLREAHHRIGNHLQMIAASAYFRRERSPAAARDFADQVLAQILATARIHQRLAQPAGVGDLGTYLREVCSDIAIICDRPRVWLRVDTMAVDVDDAIVGPLVFIAIELVTNAYKHAFKEGGSGTIRVRLLRIAADRALLSVADSGPGLPDTVPKGSGLTIVEALAQSIGADVAYSGGPGAEIGILVPRGRDR
jgi:two-component sensor histidine kinase